jgi:putative ABC transport system ATP-binding protein
MEPPAIQGKDLRKTYRLGEITVKALDGVDISLYPGEIAMLLGPSGSGKSTLLHTLAGLEPPDSGEVLANGISIYKLNDIKLSALRNRSFGFVFQSYNLLPSMTALENVQVPLRLSGDKDAIGKATEMLTKVGLKDRLRNRPGQLSGGEQQRVTIARALVTEPKVVFADEPTGNLDSTTTLEIMHLFRELITEKNAACLMVTHNSELTSVADRVLRMRDGRIVNAVDDCA